MDFSLVQHSRDKILMESFVNYFNSGGSYVNKESVRYIASKFLDIQKIIIPFFEKYPLQGYKLSNFEKFCSVADLIEKQAHLTPEGVKEIIKIKNTIK